MITGEEITVTRVRATTHFTQIKITITLVERVVTPIGNTITLILNTATSVVIFITPAKVIITLCAVCGHKVSANRTAQASEPRLC